MNSSHIQGATSQTTTSQGAFLNKVLSGARIPLGVRAYFHEQARNELHELVLCEFQKQEKAGLLSRAALAQRIGKGAPQITRWLGSPGNWTIHTVVDLLLGMGATLRFSIEHLAGDSGDATKRPQVDWRDSYRPAAVAAALTAAASLGTAQPAPVSRVPSLGSAQEAIHA